jgi:capsular polysaccharide biosynthesis protein
LQKREDARVSDAMNARDYANVTIAQEAVAPAIPVFSPLLSLLVGFLISVLVSLGTVFTAEFLDDSLRTPDDVAECLEVPVFASIPQNSN